MVVGQGVTVTKKEKRAQGGKIAIKGAAIDRQGPNNNGWGNELFWCQISVEKR